MILIKFTDWHYFGISAVITRGPLAVISTLSSIRTPPTDLQASSESQSTLLRKRSHFTQSIVQSIVKIYSLHYYNLLPFG